MNDSNMNLSDLSSNSCVVLELLADGKPHQALEMSNQLNIKRTTLRNALQRMELFGLIVMKALPNNKFEYRITSEGKALIKRGRSSQQKPVTITAPPPPPPAKPQVQSIIQEQMKQQPNVVEWLRSMAVAFNAMADSLS